MFSGDFDGSSQERRTVRMGGRKRQDSKAEFLAKARAERRRRETERIRLHAAGTLQRWWRGRWQAHQCWKTERQGWDKTVVNLSALMGALKAQGVAFAPPVPTIRALVSGLLFFYRPGDTEDAARLSRLCHMIQRSCLETDPSANWFGAAAATAPSSAGSSSGTAGTCVGALVSRIWWLTTARLLRAMIETLALECSRHHDSEMSPPFIKILMETIVIIISPEKWGLESSPAAASNHETMPQSFICLWEMLLRQVVGSQIKNPSKVKHLQKLGGGAAVNALLECWRSSEAGDDTDRASATRLLLVLVLRALGLVLPPNYHTDSVVATGLAPSQQILLEPPQSLLGMRALALELVVTGFLGEISLISQHPLFPNFSAFLARGKSEPWWMLVHTCHQVIRQRYNETIEGFGKVVSVSSEQARASAVEQRFVSNIMALQGGRLTTIELSSKDTLSLVGLLSDHMSHISPVGLLDEPISSEPGQRKEKSKKDLSAASEEEDDEEDERRDFSSRQFTESPQDTKVIIDGFRALERGAAYELRLLEDALPVTPNTETVSFLVTPSVIVELFDAVLGGSGADSLSSTSHNVGSAPMLTLCSLYGKLLCYSRGALSLMSGRPLRTADMSTAGPAAVLNTLAFGRVKHLVPRLWHALWPILEPLAREPLHEGHRKVAAATSLGASGLQETLEADMAAAGGPGYEDKYSQRKALPRTALVLFCATYSYHLLALDDDEFQRHPLTIADQSRVAVALKWLLYDLLWTRPVLLQQQQTDVQSYATTATSSPILENIQLVLVATRLYNQLYDRHARLEFRHLPRPNWHWPALHSNELVDVKITTWQSDATQDDTSGQKVCLGNHRVAMVLTTIPQVLHFTQRVRIFQRLLVADRMLRENLLGGVSQIDVIINRENLYEDARRLLDHHGPNLKGKIRVTFESELGYQEAGIDGGGLFKDFMDQLTEKAFDPSQGLFNATADQLLYPSPTSREAKAGHLDHFRFLGRVLGKAVYSQILVRPQFTTYFLNKLLQRANHIDDLLTLDPELYRHLMSLKSLVRSGYDLKELTLTFTAASLRKQGKHGQVDLIVNGSDIPVDNSNYFSYIASMANYKLNRETAAQTAAFMRGFHDLISADCIRMFDAQELQMVIGGELRPIDIDNLKAFTKYSGGYHESQPIMKWFWDILRKMTPTEQGCFLKFVTSSSRQPLLGFEYLVPNICIQKVPLHPGQEERLPSAGTCMNLLKLPNYRNPEILRSKLLYAISANAGFELS